MPIDLKDLIPATSQITQEKSVLVGLEMKKFNAKQRTRLIAQEYVRNGMDLPLAVSTITGNKLNRRLSAAKILGKNMDAFMAEVNALVGKSDIERDKALEFLWAMLHTSVLDFFDDHGHVLSIKEMKKLPRIMQMMLSKVKVKIREDVVTDEKKKPILDDNGSPYLRRTEYVEVEIPEKMAAINQLAQIMRWIGPLVKVDVNVNVGRTMVDADARTESVGRIYEGIATRMD
jgi:hypothetical protein